MKWKTKGWQWTGYEYVIYVRMTSGLREARLSWLSWSSTFHSFCYREKEKKSLIKKRNGRNWNPNESHRFKWWIVSVLDRNVPEKCKPTVYRYKCIYLSIYVYLSIGQLGGVAAVGGEDRSKFVFSILAFGKNLFFWFFTYNWEAFALYSRVLLLLFTFAFGEFKEL